MQKGMRIQANYNDDCTYHCQDVHRIDHGIPMNLVRMGTINTLEMTCFYNRGSQGMQLHG